MTPWAASLVLVICAVVAIATGQPVPTAADPPAPVDVREQPSATTPASTGVKNSTWQVWPAAGAASDSQEVGSHSWIAVPTLDADDGRDPWRLVHVPPRRTMGLDGEAHGADDGVLRPSIVLSSRPRAIAAVGSKVYVVLALSDTAGTREVLSVSAVETGVADLWADEPAGVAMPEPPIQGTGTFLGLAGTPLGPAVLLRDAGTPELRVLCDGAWREVPLTTAVLSEVGVATPESVRLLQSSEGLRLVALRGDGSVGVWDVKLTREALSSDTAVATASQEAPATGPSWKTGRNAWQRGARTTARPEFGIQTEWTFSSTRLPQELSDSKLFASVRIVSSGRQLVTAHREANGDVLLGVLGDRGWTALTRVDAVPADFAFVPLDGLGRIAVVWSAQDQSPQETGSALLSRRPGTGAHLELCEVSAFTGRVLFTGPGGRAGLVGASEFRMLAIGMLGLMAMVLTLIIRRDDEDQVFALPDGVALCEPGRRAMAGVIDLLLVFVLASRLMGISPLQFFMPSVLLSGMSVSIVLLTALLGAVIGTLTEAMFARSPGKLLMGCEVLAVVRVGGTPPNALGSLWRAAVRNAVKWGLPPLGVFGVLDPSGRHRGDHMAGTLVVVRFDPDEEDDAQE